jgi:hypothetical protein
MRSTIEDLPEAWYRIRQIFAEPKFSPVPHVALILLGETRLEPDLSSGSSARRRYGNVIVSPVPSVTAPAERAKARPIIFIRIMGSP